MIITKIYTKYISISISLLFNSKITIHKIILTVNIININLINYHTHIFQNV